MSKSKYTMSPAAHAVRKAASAKAADVRPAGRTWHTVRIDSATLACIKFNQRPGESLANVIYRLIC